MSLKDNGTFVEVSAFRLHFNCNLIPSSIESYIMDFNPTAFNPAL